MSEADTLEWLRLTSKDFPEDRITYKVTESFVLEKTTFKFTPKDYLMNYFQRVFLVRDSNI